MSSKAEEKRIAEEDRAILLCSRHEKVRIVLRPIYRKPMQTISMSKGGFVLNELVWDKTHKSIGQIMAFYDHGEVRLDSDGCVGLEDIEQLREHHFYESEGIYPSTALRMALTIHDLQKERLEVAACPFCRSTSVTRIGEWRASSTEPLEKLNHDITEWQCRNESCGRSFWA